jgi:hypothetical protein
MEQWVTILDNPDYAVSDLGRVQNNYTGRLLAISRTSGGLCYVSLQKDGRTSNRALAKLVCEAFILQPDYFDTPIHLDGDPYNCRACNLAWRPRWFSLKHKVQFRGNGSSGSRLMIQDVGTGELLDIWEAVIHYGLLYADILRSIECNTCVFPTLQRFRWAY